MGIYSVFLFINYILYVCNIIYVIYKIWIYVVVANLFLLLFFCSLLRFLFYQRIWWIYLYDVLCSVYVQHKNLQWANYFDRLFDFKYSCKSFRCTWTIFFSVFKQLTSSFLHFLYFDWLIKVKYKKQKERRKMKAFTDY